MLFVSQTIPHSGGYEAPQRARGIVSKACFGVYTCDFSDFINEDASMNQITFNLHKQIMPMSKMKKLLFYLVIFVLGLYAMEALAQQPDVGKKPRIGLVLSGGGARGLAHMGVIQVLEEMRIPISAIAGTSMGSIVGSLYASGMSPAEMEKFVTSIEWNDAFKDKPSPSQLSFRHKQDAADYLINFDLGYRDGKFAIPKGLLQGQNLNLILKSLLFHTEGIDDFNALNIPFRAVATDIETGKAVILGKGQLVKAVRASMSIPAIGLRCSRTEIS